MHPRLGHQATTGNFTYQPNPGFSGTGRFVYYAFDVEVNSLPVTVEISVEAPDLPNPFDSWAADHPFLNAEDILPGADPDGDGFINLIEYAFGSDPLSSERGVLPTIEPGTDRLSLIDHKNPLADDVLIRPEASMDLATWDNTLVTHQFFRIEGPLEVRQSSAPVPPSGSVFLRLRVSSINQTE